MGGLNGTERRAQERFEREVLECVVAHSAGSEAAILEGVEQAMGYYRHTTEDNPVQQLLGRRLRYAYDNLADRGLLETDEPELLRPTPAGRAAVWQYAQPWWQQLLGFGERPA